MILFFLVRILFFLPHDTDFPLGKVCNSGLDPQSTFCKVFVVLLVQVLKKQERKLALHVIQRQKVLKIVKSDKICWVVTIYVAFIIKIGPTYELKD